MPIDVNGETYLNTSEAMNFLGVSRTTLDAMVSDGRVRRYKQGVRRLNYFKQSELARLLEFREDTEDE